MEDSAAPPLCTARPCLERHEGRVIDVQGAYLFPRRRAFAVSKLVLEDDTTIVLSPPDTALRDHFKSDNDGVTLRIRGRVFTGPIPESYQIIGRTAEPYLLDIEAIETIGR